MGGVHRVGAVDPPRGNDLDGGLLLLHGAHLHRRGLGAQQDVIGDIEGVLGIALLKIYFVTASYFVLW